MRSRRSGHRGQALIEMALMLPLLLAILVGIFEVGPSVNDHAAVAQATEQAVRVASQLGSSSSVSETAADQQIVSTALAGVANLSQLSVQEIDIYQPSSSDGSYSNGNPEDVYNGSGQQVSLGYPMSDRSQASPNEAWIAVQIQWQYHLIFAPGNVSHHCATVSGH